MEKLIEFIQNLDTPHYIPSHLEDLKHKSEYLEVPDVETRIPRHDNPHYWLQQDILQVKNFQYRFFYNITLNDQTIPQVKVFTQFLLKFFRFNYQLLWEQQDQQAYVNFPQYYQNLNSYHISYIIKNEHRQLQYRDLTSFKTIYFEQINLDSNFIKEYFETSDSRPYITTNVLPEITPEEQTSTAVTQYIRQTTVQLEQENISNLFQRQECHQLNPLYPQLIQASDIQTSDIQPSNLSETATPQKPSELSEETAPTVQNTQSLTISNDSNLIQVPTHKITHDEINNQNLQNALKTTQDNVSVLSTSNTNITQPSHTQRSLRQNYDPPSIPPQFSTQTNTHYSSQQGSSNTQHTNTVHFQTPTPPSPPRLQTSTYTPAQNKPVQNIQTG